MSKILSHMQEAAQAAAPAHTSQSPRIVLLSTGALNPLHRGHINAMQRARDHLLSLHLNVIGGFLSPTHDDYVKPKMQRQLTDGRGGVLLEEVFASGEHRRNMVAAGASPVVLL